MDNTGNVKVIVHSGADLLKAETFFRTTPSVSWEDLLINKAQGKALITSLFFIDMGPGPPGPDIAWYYPVLHSVWTDCKGYTLDSCTDVPVGWHPPGNGRRTPNRYTFWLFNHPQPLDLSYLPKRGLGLDLPALVKNNSMVVPGACSDVEKVPDRGTYPGYLWENRDMGLRPEQAKR